MLRYACRVSVRPHSTSRISPSSCRSFLRRWNSTQQNDREQLRILFCGSDAFSSTALCALTQYARNPDSHILSIDVVTRTDKRTGRGLKVVTAPPIKIVAQELDLPVHQIDTFTKWQPPAYTTSHEPHINLIVAVSFGLLIPARILQGVKYSGLNIHPSMLPDLRGAAPLQWTIMRGYSRTGVSLQTLHPHRFDEGVILDQTPRPGLQIPHHDETTVDQLAALLAPLGAQMLVDGIRNRLYLPSSRAEKSQTQDSAPVTYAPKITPELRAVDFGTLTSLDILRRSRAVPKLHAFATSPSTHESDVRVILGPGMRRRREADVPAEMEQVVSSIPDGLPFVFTDEGAVLAQSSSPLMVNCRSTGSASDRQLVIPTITVASEKSAPGAAAAARAGLLDTATPISVGRRRLFQFKNGLTAANLSKVSI